MPKIEIKQSHNLTPEEARKRMEQLNQELGSKYSLTSTWISPTEAKVERTGATGSIRIEPKQVSVVLDLSFALSPLKGSVEAKIKELLQKSLV